MKIEKNIPIPKLKTGKPVSLVIPFDKMEIDESVLIEGKDLKIAKVNGYYQRWKRETNSEKVFTLRTVEGGIRIWRKS